MKGQLLLGFLILVGGGILSFWLGINLGSTAQILFTLPYIGAMFIWGVNFGLNLGKYIK